MNISRLIPYALLNEQVNVVMRDLCHMINYYYPNKEIARKTTDGLECFFGVECPSDYLGLPQWIHTARLSILDGEIKLLLSIDDTEEALANVDTVADSIQNNLSVLFGYKTRFFPTKVFCIGWSKTGTASITEALRTLGLFSLHGAPWVIGCMSHGCDVSEVTLNLSSIADYTSVSDLPICVLFRELDQEFPDSKFILTTRPEEDWIESVTSQLESHIEKQGIIEATTRWAYGSDQIDRQLCLQRYMQHRQEVLEYFTNRSDLLVIDIAEGDQWQKLCDFLNLPVPDSPFPHLNKRMINGAVE